VVEAKNNERLFNEFWIVLFRSVEEPTFANKSADEVELISIVLFTNSCKPFIIYGVNPE